MRFSNTLVLTLLPIVALASKQQRHSVSRSARLRRDVDSSAELRLQENNTIFTGISASHYIRREHYEGESFFDDWYFFDGNDPTHGLVNYQSRDQARQKGLAYVQDDGTTILDVGRNVVDGRRDTIRISSKKTYNRGLFIADFAAMPHGCSLWPAYWSVGPNWPQGGELDIIEGVNRQTRNQYTLHTVDRCDLPNNRDEIGVKSDLMYNRCQSLPNDNRGCGFLDTDTRSFGAGFNGAGGGVFAHEWNNDAIKIWFFPRDDIPDDIADEDPNPSSWGQPVAIWSSKYCDLSRELYDHTLIIDTTICGDWAGPAFGGSGCPGTCAEAAADNNNFKSAKWAINYISVYQS